MATLPEQLAGLATMSPAQLRAEWRRVYKAQPPKLTPDLLVRGIAYRLQERVVGGLPPASQRLLDRLAAKAARGDSIEPASDVQLKPGTRLVRSWKGTTYSVLVTDTGFVMGDQSFTSLSQIAEAITGAHWSGPRFFGVRAGRATTGAAAGSAVRRIGSSKVEAHG